MLANVKGNWTLEIPDWPRTGLKAGPVFFVSGIGNTKMTSKFTSELQE